MTLVIDIILWKLRRALANQRFPHIIIIGLGQCFWLIQGVIWRNNPILGVDDLDTGQITIWEGINDLSQTGAFIRLTQAFF